MEGRKERPIFVDIGSLNRHDYKIASAISQKLQRLRRKMLKRKEILDGRLELLDCDTRWQDLRSHRMLNFKHHSTSHGAFVA